MSTSSSPLVQRRRLRAELRTARHEAGLTQETVAEEMDWSLSKIIRIETGSVGISTNDLNALLRLYKVKDPRRTKDLLELARAARQQTWWSKYRGIIAPTYFQYIEYETSAAIIRSYESRLIPGLLQTKDYAEAITRLYRLSLAPKTVETLVEIRMKRQELLLEQPSPPLLFFILDEAVIHRLIGDEAIGRGQLTKLIDMARKPTVTIEVLPFTAGLHRGVAEDFNILEFDEPADSDVLFFESARDSIFSHDEAEEISIYRELFEDLRKVSLGPEGTLDYLIKTSGTFP